MTFNFASQSQNAEVRHLFEDNTDMETLESRILFYENRSHQLNANIFENEVDLTKVQTTNLPTTLSEEPLAEVPPPQKSDSNRFMTLEIAAVITLVVLRFFYD